MPRRTQTVTIASYFIALSIYFQSHIDVGVEYEDNRIIPVPILQYRAEVASYLDITWYCNYLGTQTSLVGQKL